MNDKLTIAKQILHKYNQEHLLMFYDELSERELSEKTGFHNMTIHNKKMKILGKLKKLMEK